MSLPAVKTSMAAVVAVHELAEIVVIANGVRAGHTNLGAASSELEPTPHRMAHTGSQKTTAARRSLATVITPHHQ